MKPKVVIDANILVSSLSHTSATHWVIQLILKEEIEVFLTNEILFEYEEILTVKYSRNVAEDFLIALRLLPNVHFVTIYFQWNLLNDSDDNKFIDCYVAAGAEYLLTHDNDFNILKSVPFPPVNVLRLEYFHEIINHNS